MGFFRIKAQNPGESSQGNGPYPKSLSQNGERDFEYPCIYVGLL
jgi:hypothetical protein